jgi:hypothetical protein
MIILRWIFKFIFWLQMNVHCCLSTKYKRVNNTEKRMWPSANACVMERGVICVCVLMKPYEVDVKTAVTRISLLVNSLSRLGTITI